MSEEPVVGCSRPTGGVVGEDSPEESSAEQASSPQETGGKPMIRVGQKAPDFVAPAYFNGKFTSVKFSDYLGKWVVLCFYPGDFTFV